MTSPHDMWWPFSIKPPYTQIAIKMIECARISLYLGIAHCCGWAHHRIITCCVRCVGSVHAVRSPFAIPCEKVTYARNIENNVDPLTGTAIRYSRIKYNVLSLAFSVCRCHWWVLHCFRGKMATNSVSLFATNFNFRILHYQQSTHFFLHFKSSLVPKNVTHTIVYAQPHIQLAHSCPPNNMANESKSFLPPHFVNWAISFFPILDCARRVRNVFALYSMMNHEPIETRKVCCARVPQARVLFHFVRTISRNVHKMQISRQK